MAATRSSSSSAFCPVPLSAPPPPPLSLVGPKLHSQRRARCEQRRRPAPRPPQDHPTKTSLHMLLIRRQRRGGWRMTQTAQSTACLVTSYQIFGKKSQVETGGSPRLGPPPCGSSETEKRGENKGRRSSLQRQEPWSLFRPPPLLLQSGAGRRRRKTAQQSAPPLAGNTRPISPPPPQAREQLF